MGLRKGGGKKKGNRKRKANVWDDAETKTKRGEIPSKNDVVPRKSRTKGSMMGQWKARKISERTKERKFFASVEEKKRWQREHYEAAWEHTVDAIYKKKEEVQEDVGDEMASDESKSKDSESEDEDVLDEKSRITLFDEFVNTFKVEEIVEKDDEELEEEEKYEAVVDAGGDEEEEEEEEEEKEEEEEEEEEVKNEERDQVAAMEKDDEVLVEEHDEEEQEDPYRRRYLLSSFSEEDAKKFDAQKKKFTKVDILASDEKRTYDVTYRNGANEDIKGVAGVVTTPELAVKKKPYVRSRLLATWKQRGLDPDTLFTKGSVERTLLQQLLAYTDVYFAGQTFENTATLRRIMAMHVLNHVLKARDTVTRNNERIKKRDAGNADEDEEDKYRDQGFCRASVLILLPLRSAAVAFVNQLLELLPSTIDTIHNKDRFYSEFGCVTNEDDDNAQPRKTDDKKEWQRVFDEGNNDDCFQLGVSFSRKAVRFYSDYHHADIILASPLGLRHQLGDEVAVLNDAKSPTALQLSSDFLSTIEVCVIDSVSLMMMQNFDHLRTVLRATNVYPKEAPEADFARVRDWNLSCLAAYFRQTIVLGHNLEPLVQTLFTKTCRNISGIVKYNRYYDETMGTLPAISRLVPPIRQIFQRVDINFTGHISARDEVDLRFQYFKTHVFEPLLAHPQKHVVIFIPSYFDYVRVRNLFHDASTQNLIQSVQCCEYTTRTQISRARTRFYHGRCHVMLYTERFHFYHQYFIRGIHQVIWYSLPMMDTFYVEMLNMVLSKDKTERCPAATSLTSSTEVRCSIVLFTRFDYFRLQRLVGNKRAERMCRNNSANPTYLFT